MQITQVWGWWRTIQSGLIWRYCVHQRKDQWWRIGYKSFFKCVNYTNHNEDSIVGLSFTYKPNNTTIGTINLCAGGFCIIFKIFSANFIPRQLEDFLNSGDSQFVDKFSEYGLNVSSHNWKNLSSLTFMRRPDVLNQQGIRGVRASPPHYLEWDMDFLAKIFLGHLTNSWATSMLRPT